MPRPVEPVTVPTVPTGLTVTRDIAADPTGTALLLAGPTAVDLWPGSRRVGDRDGRVLVECAPLAAVAAVRALPPRRTPTSFVTTFAWSGAGLPAAEGRLTLTYLPGAGPAHEPVLPATRAELTVTLVDPGVGSRLTPGLLRAMAVGFLDNLAAAAEERSAA